MTSLRFPRTISSTTTGEWVAVRDGKVVAHDVDPEALQANPAVLPTDDVFPVGDPPVGVLHRERVTS